MFAFPPSARLKRRSQFQRALDGGRKVVNRELVLVYCERSHIPGANQGPRTSQNHDVTVATPAGHNENNTTHDQHSSPQDPAGARPGARLGLIVSRKVGNAVTRNRVKRCLREAFRTLAPHERSHDADFVVIARARAAQCGTDALRRSLANALRRATGHQRQEGARRLRRETRTSRSTDAPRTVHGSQDKSAIRSDESAPSRSTSNPLGKGGVNNINLGQFDNQSMEQVSC